MTGVGGRRYKQLLDNLQEKREYWKLKEEALDRIVWRTGVGRSFGMNKCVYNVYFCL
jgi:hypothetical protein